MPIIMPKGLPAYEILENENVFTMPASRADTQDIRPLKIATVNLMPTKVATETQIARVLANTPLQVNLTLIHMDTHTAKNTSALHLDAFYKTFDEIKKERFDGMIITGAPVETMDFADVDYWDELCDIMEYSKTNVFSTLHLCWSAQAALFYHYNIEKQPIPSKMFGIFPHEVIDKKCPLVRGFDEVFFAPHSRHTQINPDQVSKCKELQVISHSQIVGNYILMSQGGRQIFVTGHPEYDVDTLDKEYKRDLSQGKNIMMPVNYYKDNCPDNQPVFSWRAHAYLLYTNWLNYYVYQNTPFDLNTL